MNISNQRLGKYSWLLMVTFSWILYCYFGYISYREKGKRVSGIKCTLGLEYLGYKIHRMNVQNDLFCKEFSPLCIQINDNRNRILVIILR